MNNPKIKTPALNAGIHTEQIVGTPNRERGKLPKGVRTIYKEALNRETGALESSYIINLNSLIYSDFGYIDSLKDYNTVHREFCKEWFTDEPTIKRIDFRIDNYTDDYQAYLKVNDLIVILLAKLKKMSCTKTYDPVTLKQKAHTAQNKNFIVQYYDRIDKNKLANEVKAFMTSEGELIDINKGGKTKARLELRNKTKKFFVLRDIPELIDTWCRELKNCSDLYDEVLNEINQNLLTEWQNGKYTNIRAFVREHKADIYDKVQLQALLSNLGTKDVKSLYYDLVKHTDVSVVSSKVLKRYINAVVRALKTFKGNVTKSPKSRGKT